MNKKFLSVMLFGALLASSTATFVSCKDYDDDIDNLQSQIDKIDVNSLDSKIATLEKSIADAKADAANQLTSAKSDLNKAMEDKVDSKTEKDLEDKVAALEKRVKDLEDGLATPSEELKQAKQDLIDLIAKGDDSNKEALKQINDDLDAIKAEIEAVIGSRLTSVVFIPKTNINGIPAIKFVSLSYEPQVYKAEAEVGEGSTSKKEDALTIGNGETTAYYRLNPRVGVTTKDFDFPSFDCITSNNEVTESAMSRSVSDKNAKVNSPIAPVEGQEFTISEDGVLAVKIKKTITENIDRVIAGNDNGYTENFYMASLNLPISEKNLTDSEKKATNKPSVHSEYVRIAETTVSPYIKSTLAGQGVGFYSTKYNTFPNEIDADGKPLHYSDSLRLYLSKNNELVDKEVAYNEAIDLHSLVTVCNKATHATIDNYKSYGLAYRFFVADKYIQGTNKTDEQQFAKINSKEGGILSSRVYSVGNDSQSKTAIGREPIIRACLMDTVNNKLVAQRYIKIRWASVVIAPTVLPVYTFPNDTVSCSNIENVFGTKEMNELIYHAVNGTMSKTDFHATYTDLEITKLTKDGVELKAPTYSFSTIKDNTKDVQFYLRPDADDNTSYNLVWALSPKAVGTILQGGSKYVITVKFKGASNATGAVTKDFALTVVTPAQNFTYNGTYWNGGSHNASAPIFNINPINYKPTLDAAVASPADGIISNAIAGLKETSPYSQIKTDLVNGYMYKATNAKPANMAQFIQYIHGCAEAKFVFDESKFANYSYLKDYKVSSDGTQLWKGTVGEFTKPNKVISDLRNDVAYQKDACAAWISNNIGADATENLKNLKWDINEAIGSGNNECSAMFQLAEADYLNGTEAAKELVGKKVPVKLVVKYNEFNTVVVDNFEVDIITPLNINSDFKGELSDNIYGGSFVGVQEAFTSTDWNKYLVSAKAPATPSEFQKYAEELYHFYGVTGIVIDTKNVHTDLAWNEDGSSYDQKDGVKTGELPTGASLVQLGADKTTVVTVNPIWLQYLNYEGSPVNKDYHLFVSTKVNYKWGTVTNSDVTITVKKRLDK